MCFALEKQVHIVMIMEAKMGSRGTKSNWLDINILDARFNSNYHFILFLAL